MIPQQSYFQEVSPKDYQPVRAMAPDLAEKRFQFYEEV